MKKILVLVLAMLMIVAAAAGFAEESKGLIMVITPSHANPYFKTVADVAVAKANEVCTLNPFPTAPRVAPNVNDGTWSVGVASAYNVATNDDGRGHFGVTSTASGIALSEGSITVAVPASKSYLMGSIVEICYDGKVVIATVTDTGGFAKYGRDLDLAPGVYKALGFSTPNDWGTRSVHYRFL